MIVNLLSKIIMKIIKLINLKTIMSMNKFLKISITNNLPILKIELGIILTTKNKVIGKKDT